MDSERVAAAPISRFAACQLAAVVPWSTWIILALVFLLVVILEGSYRILGKGDLVGTIQQITVGVEGDGGVGIIVVASIRNLGVPTILDRWTLEIELPGGKLIRALHGVGWEKLDLAFLSGQSQVFTKEHDLMEQTLRQPLQTNAQVFGVARFKVEGMDKSIINQAGTRILLKYQDARGNEYVAQYTMLGRSDGPLPYIPGIGPIGGGVRA
jgi:hypothetical protein